MGSYRSALGRSDYHYSEDEINEIDPIFIDKVEKLAECFYCASKVYDRGVLGHFGTFEDLRLDTVKKS